MIPLFSHIITLADAVEIAYQNKLSADEISANITKAKGVKFSPIICEVFESLARNTSFWLSLDNMFVERELINRVPVFHVNLDYPELLLISGIMSEIIDAKSPFTASHSKGLSTKIGVMADYYGFDYEKKTRLIIAADLHDIGKLAIPNSIIDKQGKLTTAEFNVIKTHSFYTRKVIESVKGFEDICEWASNHHEKLNGTGYPFGFSEQHLSFESQLLSCMDIYQALTENRPYREGLSHEKTSEILIESADKGMISREIASDIAARCRMNLDSNV